MGSLVAGDGVGARRPRFLCLHGFRTSGEIMRKQVVGKWPAEVTARLDLVFPDAPFPAEGKSDVDGIFDPPYYEWFQFDKVRAFSPRTTALLPWLPDLSICPLNKFNLVWFVAPFCYFIRSSCFLLPRLSNVHIPRIWGRMTLVFPSYSWIFLFRQGFTEYRNLDRCFDYIEELMIKEGPFDGLMGFSQVIGLGTASFFKRKGNS
jgi:hypothetical protein